MGLPKATLPFGPEPMIRRVLRLLGEAVGPLTVVAAQDQQLPDLPPTVRIVHDRREGVGPLEGLRGGLTAIRDRGWDWFALQLADQRELMYYQLRRDDGQASRYSSGTLVAANGTVGLVRGTDCHGTYQGLPLGCVELAQALALRAQGAHQTLGHDP